MTPLIWIRKYCYICKERTRHEYIGIQKFKTCEVDLYNCSKCNTTRAVNLRKLEKEVETRQKNGRKNKAKNI